MGNRSKAHENDSQNVLGIRNSCNQDTIKLGKSKKDDQIKKRHNIDANATSPLQEHNFLASPPNKQPLYSSLEEIIMHMKCDDPILVYRATQAVRNMLSQEPFNPPSKTLIEHGIVSICVDFLESPR